ncbi:MAG TPA: hypothetical protein PJ988_19620 [Anaerolinea sp.]|nr:hypothetical protein [Anaerolinea sp.]
MRKWLPWILAALLLGVGGLFLARWVIAQVESQTQQANSLAAHMPVATSTGPIVSEQRMFDPNLDPQSRESLSEKIAIQTRTAADQAAGEANPAPKDKVPPLPAQPQQAVAGPQAQVGIFNGSEGMVKPEQAQINNYWQGEIDGKPTMVLAGAEPQDSAKGLVIVVTSDGFSVTGFHIIPAPEGVSSLKAVDYTPQTLFLEDANGNRLTFDLKTQAFAK